MDGPTAQYLRPIAGIDAAVGWAWLLLAGALQAGSHILEPLPPRFSWVCRACIARLSSARFASFARFVSQWSANRIRQV